MTKGCSKHSGGKENGLLAHALSTEETIQTLLWLISKKIFGIVLLAVTVAVTLLT